MGAGEIKSLPLQLEFQRSKASHKYQIKTSTSIDWQYLVAFSQVDAHIDRILFIPLMEADGCGYHLAMPT